MDWAGSSSKVGLFASLFDSFIYTKGYAGGLVSFRRTDCLDIGSLGVCAFRRMGSDDGSSQLHVSGERVLSGIFDLGI